jgi:subtilase family serine protease
VDAYDNPTILNDLDTYSDYFGIPRLNRCAVSAGTAANPCIQKVDQNGGTSYPTYDGGWAGEIALDVEAVHAMCQNCNILLVEATSYYDFDLITAADARAYLMGANVISNSWGRSETSFETAYDSTFNHPGVAFVFSTGDYGYGVQYPAASPNVTAVGGTSLWINSDNSYNSETAWNRAGSGCSAYEPKPSFQHDTGCPNNRTVADVSADADPNTGAAVYINGSWSIYGGTSLSAPLVAAVFALAGGVGNTVGNSLPYANLNYGVNLHDVTSGSNGSCGGSYLCTAMAGYDGPTGLGSPLGSAAFSLESFLSVTKTGTGTGTVTSNPPGINCGSTCSYAFTNNTVVTLTAAAISPSTFGGWNGAGCSGTGTCTVTMSTAHSVTATFNSGVPPVSVVDVFTTDENGMSASLGNGPHVITGNAQTLKPSTVKTVFNPGDPIKLFIEAYNQDSTDETASFQWIVLNPAGNDVTALEWSGDLDTAAGTKDWSLSSAIPADSPFGDYTFTGKITFNGVTTTSSTNFYVNGPYQTYFPLVLR